MQHECISILLLEEWPPHHQNATGHGGLIPLKVLCPSCSPTVGPSCHPCPPLPLCSSGLLSPPAASTHPQSDTPPASFPSENAQCQAETGGGEGVVSPVARDQAAPAQSDVSLLLWVRKCSEPHLMAFAPHEPGLPAPPHPSAFTHLRSQNPCSSTRLRSGVLPPPGTSHIRNTPCRREQGNTGYSESTRSCQGEET